MYISANLHGFNEVATDEVKCDAGSDVRAVDNVSHNSKHSEQNRDNHHAEEDDFQSILVVLHLVLQWQYLRT